MSFSTPFEIYPPTPARKSGSQVQSVSPKSSDSRPAISNAVSTPEHVQDEIVEDALRARAEQAESAAERLLELVEPEENGNHLSTIPPSLLLGSNGNGNVTPKPKLKPKASPAPISRTFSLPVTPLNRNSAILKQPCLRIVPVQRDIAVTVGRAE